MRNIGKLMPALPRMAQRGRCRAWRDDMTRIMLYMATMAVVTREYAKAPLLGVVISGRKR